MKQQPLFMSVVVPAHNAELILPKSLGALLESDFPRHLWELIVVDDGSSDETADMASRYADNIVRLPGRPHGPAYARNRGVEVTRGNVIAFFDSDVVAHPDSLRRMAEILDANPDIVAVFGAYDADPPAPGLASQYQNLIHHYVHVRNAGEVETFWAGAGAVRRDAFVNAGMFDEWHYARPQIEDIELGARLRAGGGRILLSPDIQVTHLKRWRLRDIVRTDIVDRGIPWARLLAHRGVVLSTSTLNLHWSEKLNTLLVWFAPLLLILGMVLHRRSLVVAALLALVAVIATNGPLWRFFIRVRGPWFALRAIPMHLLYYLLSGISFVLGLSLQQLVGPPLRDPTTEAFAEVGVKRWPPVPERNRPSSWTADKP